MILEIDYKLIIDEAANFEANGIKAVCGALTLFQLGVCHRYQLSDDKSQNVEFERKLKSPAGGNNWLQPDRL